MSNLFDRLADAFAFERAIPLALAIEVESDLPHAWKVGRDGDRFGLLVWARPMSLSTLVNIDPGAARTIHSYMRAYHVDHVDGTSDDDAEVTSALRRWLHQDSQRSDWDWSEQVKRLIQYSAAAAKEWQRLIDAGPPTLAEIVEMAGR
jgi:hypothetical protein